MNEETSNGSAKHLPEFVTDPFPTEKALPPAPSVLTWADVTIHIGMGNGSDFVRLSTLAHWLVLDGQLAITLGLREYSSLFQEGDNGSPPRRFSAVVSFKDNGIACFTNVKVVNRRIEASATGSPILATVVLGEGT